MEGSKLGRSPDERPSLAAETIENFRIQATGGITRRRGTQLVKSRPIERMVPLLGDLLLFSPIESRELIVDEDTDILIYFDASGSMNSTLAPLNEMRDTLLRDALIGFYGGDDVLYNQRVRVISWSDERTFRKLYGPDAFGNTGNLVVLMFQDEASPSYHGASTFPPTTTFDSDMTTFKSMVDALVANRNYRSNLFQVATVGSVTFTTFKTMMEHIYGGIAPYDAARSLADYSSDGITGITYDVTPGSAASYYLNLVTSTLTALGYNLNP